MLTLNVFIMSLFFDLTVQDDVRSPKSTKCSCLVMWSLVGGQDEIKTVELIIETTPANIDWNPKDKCYSRNCFLLFCIEF